MSPVIALIRQRIRMWSRERLADLASRDVPGGRAGSMVLERARESSDRQHGRFKQSGDGLRSPTFKRHLRRATLADSGPLTRRCGVVSGRGQQNRHQALRLIDIMSSWARYRRG